MAHAKDSSAAPPEKHFADSGELDKIMYIQQLKDMYPSCFGGLMATRLKTLGAAGVVLDGRFRHSRDPGAGVTIVHSRQLYFRI
jgi:regulator of RNase E activity RraA